MKWWSRIFIFVGSLSMLGCSGPVQRQPNQELACVRGVLYFTMRNGHGAQFVTSPVYTRNGDTISLTRCNEEDYI